MHYDAIVLAGGRSRRLGGTPKAALRAGGRTLLATTLAAASSARRIVVVGPRPDEPLPAGIIVVREEPPFGGPAAALAAGLDALAVRAAAADWVLVLACDMPRVAAAVAALTDALRCGVAAASPAVVSAGPGVAPAAGPAAGPGGRADDASADPRGDGVLATDATGRLQPLAAAYRRAALADAVARHRAAGTLEGGAMFALVRGLSLTPVAVPVGAVDDVDTWDDARRLGLRPDDAHDAARTAAVEVTTDAPATTEPGPRGGRRTGR